MRAVCGRWPIACCWRNAPLYPRTSRRYRNCFIIIIIIIIINDRPRVRDSDYPLTDCASTLWQMDSCKQWRRQAYARGHSPHHAAQPLSKRSKGFYFLRYRLFGLFPLGEPYQAQIRFYYHQWRDWRRQLVGTWARAPPGVWENFFATLKQVVWFGLVLCQTLIQHYLFSRTRFGMIP